MESCTVCFAGPIMFLVTAPAGTYQYKQYAERCYNPSHFLVCGECARLLAAEGGADKLAQVISDRGGNYFPMSLVPLLASQYFDLKRVWTPAPPPYTRYAVQQMTLDVPTFQRSDDEADDDRTPF